MRRYSNNLQSALLCEYGSIFHNNCHLLILCVKLNNLLGLTSGVARGAARPGHHHFGVTPFGVTSFGVTPYYDVKPTFHRFVVNTFLFSLCLVPILIWTENPLILRGRPFLFLVFTNFCTEKGCHHEIPPRMPPSLATSLVLTKALWLHLVQEIYHV